jgi:glycosyltransferase involved in cell wall biosynthesis
MKIGLHLGTLRGHGSGAVGLGILGEITRAAGHRFFAWVPREWESAHGIGPGALGDHVTIYQTDPGTREKFILETFRIPRTIQKTGIEKLFSLGDTSTPLCPVPHLLLIHQPHLATPFKDYGFPLPWKDFLRYAAMKSYLRVGLPGISKITVQSQAMKAGLQRQYALEDERISVIPSAVEGLPSHKDSPRPTMGAPVLSYIASVSPHKNHILLPGILHLLKAKYPGVRCNLTIESSAIPSFTEKARKLGVLDCFRFHGPVAKELSIRLAQEADVILNPSKLESFGLTYYESMALGKPMVASRKAFAEEACHDAAVYAHPDDPKEWADAVSSLLDSREGRERLSAKALARYESTKVGWDRVAHSYLCLLESM